MNIGQKFGPTNLFSACIGGDFLRPAHAVLLRQGRVRAIIIAEGPPSFFVVEQRKCRELWQIEALVKYHIGLKPAVGQEHYS